VLSFVCFQIPAFFEDYILLFYVKRVWCSRKFVRRAGFFQFQCSGDRDSVGSKKVNM